ncbi:agamous-like MADS-box protein AGL29 [Panicum miliaceum]|uniref:Agamous-like MADS-box protein AGL29 n=1 Tax=Panicum miliaceum TaxID=4540 RepID=A0A3L6T8E0_PANMI|nr:agamous-like MADS-box protein AGL29 [Panicum miliaceum]
MEYLELEQSLEAEKKRKERLQEATEKEMGGRVMQWLNANVFELGLDELEEFQKKLEEIQAIVKEKVNEVMVEGRQAPRSLPQPPMEMASTSQSANPNPMASSSAPNPGRKRRYLGIYAECIWGKHELDDLLILQEKTKRRKGVGT